VESRDDAIRILTEQRAETLALLERLPPRARTRPGLGGGAWSPKDLLGHLESWEQHALDALAAWDRNERAPIDLALRREGLTSVNRREVERKATRSYPSIVARAARTHARLLDAIGSMSDQRWHAPATSRGRKPLGHRLGQLLVGVGPFGHDQAHLPSLRAFVRDGRRSIP
jgi:hypothetical protein